MERLASLGLKYARLSSVSKVGRAASGCQTSNQLSPEDLYNLLQWLAKKREEYSRGQFPLEIEFSDDGWCGLRYELLTKKIEHIFFCATGITVGSILYDGKVAACPHIARDLTVQGDALTERFSHVWNKRFKLFRNKIWLKKGRCKKCEEWLYCRGGPLHYRNKDGTMRHCLYEEILQVDNYEDLIRPPQVLAGARIKIKDLPVISFAGDSARSRPRT